MMEQLTAWVSKTVQEQHLIPAYSCLPASAQLVFQFYTDTEVQLILMHSINHDGSSTHHSSLITSSVMNHDYGVKLSQERPGSVLVAYGESYVGAVVVTHCWNGYSVKGLHYTSVPSVLCDRHDNGYLFNFHKDNDYIDRKDLQ